MTSTQRKPLSPVPLLDRLARLDPLHRLGSAALNGRSRPLLLSAVVTFGLAVILAGVGASAFAISGVALAARSATRHLASTKTAAVRGRSAVVESMVIPDGTTKLTNSSWTIHAGQKVIIRITSHDDGNAPLMGSQTVFGKVQGTIGGIEAVDGKSLASVSNQNIAHTFTVVGLGLNLPIPAAPKGGTVTVVASFVSSRTGTYTWQCYAPCGDGDMGMGGAMSTMGAMEGRVRVIS